MPSFHSWRARGGRFLARYLSRLADNLETLTVRLRDAVASAVSQAVAEATQETVRTVLDAAQAPRSPRLSPSGYNRPPTHLARAG
jgi:hypothetical protein